MDYHPLMSHTDFRDVKTDRIIYYAKKLTNKFSSLPLKDY